MPVYSMTGYASVQHSTGTSPSNASHTASQAIQLGLEIRSVNSRFLDLSFRLPEELRTSEPALRELVLTQLRRGKVEIRASVESVSPTQLQDPSPRLMQRLNAVQDGIKAWLPHAAVLSVADVMRLAAAERISTPDLRDQVLTLATQALSELREARAREGERLGTMLLGHVAQLKALGARATPLIPQLVQQQRQRFLERWREAMNLTEGSTLPEAAHDRALAEATAFAIRIDVAEEITRLDSHLNEAQRLISKGGEIGKRLDFLIQEMLREANTLGSKAAALELTHISVDMKVLIEQMREQVQNIE